MVIQKPFYMADCVSIHLVRVEVSVRELPKAPERSNGCGEGSYSHRFVHGLMAAVVGVLVVSVPARLAGQGSPALAGGSRCCPAKRLHDVSGVECWRRESLQ